MPISSRPQFRQVADLLREAIETGQYPPGSLLPPEPQLAELYGVGRQTINNAVAVLRAEGLVRVLRGKGTVVRQIPPIHRNAVARYQSEARERAGGRGAFDTEIRELGHTPRTETEVSEVPASAEVAQLLGLAEGAAVVARARLMFADDVPVQIATSYIPADIARGTPLAEADSGPGGIISRFAELGYAQARISESVRARAATEDERQALAMDDAQPVLQITHTGWTADERAVEVAVHVVPAGGWILDYEWRVS